MAEGAGILFESSLFYACMLRYLIKESHIKRLIYKNADVPIPRAGWTFLILVYVRHCKETKYCEYFPRLTCASTSHRTSLTPNRGGRDH